MEADQKPDAVIPEIPSIDQEMSIETLCRILRTQSYTLVAHEASIKALKQRNEELVEAQNILRGNVETLRDLVEKLSQVVIRAASNAGRGMGMN